MSTIKIKQVKSRIGAPADQKRTLDALGLHKLNRVVEHECTPSWRMYEEGPLDTSSNLSLWLIVAYLQHLAQYHIV